MAKRFISRDDMKGIMGALDCRGKEGETPSLLPGSSVWEWIDLVHGGGYDFVDRLYAETECGGA